MIVSEQMSTGIWSPTTIGSPLHTLTNPIPPSKYKAPAALTVSTQPGNGS
jgi:hypothetical protein